MGVIAQAEHRVANLRTRGAEWAESRDPASASGVAIAAWRRYEAVDGPQQSALLALYFLIAIVPALLVIEEYLETTPGALANSLVHHYSLSAQTAELLRSVLVDSRQHELGSALLAVAAALFFGLGFGRVLQLVHVRAWGLPTQCADERVHSPVLTGVITPPGVDADGLRQLIHERFDLSLGAGLGKLKGRMFRIGHLGDCNDLTLMAALSGVEMGLKLAGVPLAGSGVLAAMDFFAARPAESAKE